MGPCSRQAEQKMMPVLLIACARDQVTRLQLSCLQLRMENSCTGNLCIPAQEPRIGCRCLHHRCPVRQTRGRGQGRKGRRLSPGRGQQALCRPPLPPQWTGRTLPIDGWSAPGLASVLLILCCCATRGVCERLLLRSGSSGRGFRGRCGLKRLGLPLGWLFEHSEILLLRQHPNPCLCLRLAG